MRQINSELTRDKVVNALRREILYGHLKAGDVLYQDKIAAELGVSRLPVREALQILGNEGLVNVRPNKVAVINNISGKFLKDHFAFRSFLEQEAARAACRQQMDCGPLWDNYRLAEAAIDRRDYSRFDEYNRAIHAILWHAPDNSQMERVLSQLWNTFITDEAHSQRNARESNADHAEIIRAIEARDGEAAARLVDRHVHRSYSRILQFLSGENPL